MTHTILRAANNEFWNWAVLYVVTTFYVKDGRNRFLQNAGNHLPDCTVS
jgi:hypothetical protein